jgi:hypothetical protein
MRRILFGLALLLSILDDSFGQSSQPPVISNQNAAQTQQHNEGTEPYAGKPHVRFCAGGAR